MPDQTVYVETHAGAPLHVLGPSGEWHKGIEKALRFVPRLDHPYFSLAAEYVGRGRYPASWVFAADRLARRARAVAVHLADTSDAVAGAYQVSVTSLAPSNVMVTFQQADGFGAANTISAASLVFVDPPFSPDPKAEWRALARTCDSLSSRGTPFLAWYPFYWPTEPQRLSDSTGCRAWEAWWSRCGPKPSQNMKGCGVLVSHQVATILEALVPRLREVAASISSELNVREPYAT